MSGHSPWPVFYQTLGIGTLGITAFDARCGARDEDVLSIFRVFSPAIGHGSAR